MDTPHLTPAQLRVATLVHAGYSNQQIADTLGITRKTVKNHLNATYGKGGEHPAVNRAELCAQCENGTLGMFHAAKHVDPQPNGRG
jgi:DNA-binding CsgD family transcriptional regulator